MSSGSSPSVLRYNPNGFEVRGRLDRQAGPPLPSTSTTITTQGFDIDGLIDVAKEKCRVCDEKKCKVRVGDHEVILRDYAVRVTKGLAMAGDIAVEFIPGPAKIVWPVLKGIMTVSTRRWAAY